MRNVSAVADETCLTQPVDIVSAVGTEVGKITAPLDIWEYVCSRVARKCCVFFAMCEATPMPTPEIIVEPMISSMLSCSNGHLDSMELSFNEEDNNSGTFP